MKWDVAGRIAWAWILTIPAAAIVAAVSFWIVEFFHKLFSQPQKDTKGTK